MRTLNHNLEEAVLQADGSYLDTQQLLTLEQYFQSYVNRLTAYQSIRDNSEKWVLETLRKFAQAYPEIIRHHGQRCKYDMSEVLRYIALSILRDDEVFFKEQMMDWLNTILHAHHKTQECGMAYRHLQEVLQRNLPANQYTLVRPYMEIVLNTLQNHA